MKKSIFLITISFIIAACCKKENNIKTNVLSGKLKTLKEYYSAPDSINYLIYFHYEYDTISRDLKKVTLEVKQSGIYSNIGIITINKIDDNTIIYNDDIDKRKFKIYLSGQQITEIREIDTLTNSETTATAIFLVDNVVDSISDVGLSSANFNNIQVRDFIFMNNNCKSFDISWVINFGIPINQRDTLLFSYSNYLNSGVIPNQLPYYFSGGSIMSFLSFNLSLNGYYITQPNKNLIDSINFSSKKDLFSYQFINQRVSKITYTYSYRPDYIMYHNLEYY